MGTPKNVQKKVLDALKDQLNPITDSEGSSLSGGFASGSADADAEGIDVNISCPENSKCNVVAGCGGTTTPTKPTTSA